LQIHPDVSAVTQTLEVYTALRVFTRQSSPTLSTPTLNVHLKKRATQRVTRFNSVHHQANLS
jgi:hypothetical protein